MRTLLLLSTGLGALLISSGAALAQSTPTPEQATQIDPVSVLATRTATPVNEVPVTVSVISDDEIEAMLATDIKDLVRYEPGVSVINQPMRFGAALGTTGRAGNAGFTIRGMGGDRVLQIIDGIRQPDGFVFGAQSVGRGGYSDLDLIQSVEILRGPASALYGSDGVAGAVSFTTRDPVGLLNEGRDFGVRAKVGYNSVDQGWTESLALAGRAGDFEGLLAYTRRDSSEAETHGDNDSLNTTRTEANPLDMATNAVLGKLVWRNAPGQRLRLTYEHFDSELDVNVLSGRSATVLDLQAHDESQRDRVSLDYRVEDVFGLDRAQASIYWQDSTTTQFTFEDRNPAVDRTRLNTFDNRVWGVAADARRTLTAGGVEHRITFGGDWSTTRQEGVRDGTVPPAGETFPTRAFPNTDYDLMGLFIQDEIELAGGALTLTPAVRWDAYELSPEDDAAYPASNPEGSDDSHVSLKFGAVWRVTKGFQLFGNVGQGFKAPTPMQVNNFFSNPAFGYVSRPSPDLGPETSVSYEVGFRLRDQDFAFGRMNFQAVAFRSDYEDFITQEVVSGSFTPSDPAVYQYVNLNEVRVEGLEFRGGVEWDNGFAFRGSAAWATGEQTTSAGRASLPSIDPIKLVAGLAWNDPEGRFGGEAIVTHSEAKDQRNTDALGCYGATGVGCYVGDDFTLLDVIGYWNVTDNVTARAGVFNVFDEKYGWWSDISGVSATSAVADAYTQPGRNFSISLALRY